MLLDLAKGVVWPAVLCQSSCDVCSTPVIHETGPYSETLLSFYHYFPKALVEDSHVFKGMFMVLEME